MDEVEVNEIPNGQVNDLMTAFTAADAEKASRFRALWEVAEDEHGRYTREAYDAALSQSGLTSEEATSLLLAHSLYQSQTRN